MVRGVRGTRGEPRLLALSLGLLAVLGGTLQGCNVEDVPSHLVGNWRGEPDYLGRYQFIPPGTSPATTRPQLNSCRFDPLAQALQCNGRGQCRAWNQENLHNPISFCECDRDWADPECRTPRKSQLYAYFISLFFGFTGADLFYLGYPIHASAKLCTLGGFGVWWLADVVRIGSAPVYAQNFRVAADLPHWAFVLTTITYFFTLGFVLVGCSTVRSRRSKRKDALLLQAEEEAAAQGEYPPYSVTHNPQGLGRFKGEAPAPAPAPAYSFPRVWQQVGANPFFSPVSGGGWQNPVGRQQV